MTVAELNRRMSSAELTEWQAYLRIEREEAEEQRMRSELEARASAGLNRRKARR